jgi:hypothetical protein
MVEKPSTVPVAALIAGLIALPLCAPLGLLILGSLVTSIGKKKMK